MTDGGAGFTPVYLAPETPAWLAENDPEALREIIGNNEFGEAAGLW